MSNGIYSYFDRQEGRVVYVGKDSAIDKQTRHKAHMTKSCYNVQQINRVLQNNPDRYHYGVIIEGDFDDCTLNALEQYYIWTYNTFEGNGFNYTEGGDGNYGFKHSDETRDKMSEAHKGKTLSEEHKSKISASKKGKKPSAETRKKMSAALSGEKNPAWKDYARVLKSGFDKGKQKYCLRYKGKFIKYSLDKSKLEEIANKLNKEEDNELFTNT